MGLMPRNLEKYSMLCDKEKLLKFNVMNCMECGCCVFNCPASRPIVQAIKVGKSIIGKGNK